MAREPVVFEIPNDTKGWEKNNWRKTADALNAGTAIDNNVSSATTGDKTKISDTDKVPDYLNLKLIAGTGITLIKSKTGNMGGEILTASSSAVSTHVDLTDMPDTNGTNTDHDIRYVTKVQTAEPTVPTPFTGMLWYDTDATQVPLAAADVTNTPAGSIAAVTVQAAIDELDTEKTTLAAVKADTDVASAISLKHASGSDNQDLSGLVVKVAGSSLLADTEAAKIHVAGSDNQDLSGLVVRVAGSSLVADTEIAKIHASGSDNQNAAGVSIADAGGLITATDVEGALQENRTAINLNTAKTTNATHSGDVTGATALTIAAKAVTYAKIQDVSADKVLGSVAGGAPEEIACTAAGRALIDDANAAAQATTLGLGAADGPSHAHLHLTDAPATGGALITAAESWIGPSATAGVYFKGGMFGFGGVPTAKLDVFSATGGASSGIRLMQVAENAAANSSYVPIDFTVPTAGLIGQLFATAANYANVNVNLPAKSICFIAHAGSLCFFSLPATGDIRFGVGGASATYEKMRITVTGNVGLGLATFGTSATKTIAVGTGVAPSAAPPANAFQMYSADIAAGEAAPHFQTEHGDVIKLYQQAHIADASDAATAITQINAILVVLENTGLLATV